MNKNLLKLLLAVALCLALSACGRPAAPDPDPAPEEQEPTVYSTQGVCFEVPSGWTQAEGTDLFYTANQREVYGLNGASILSSYTPQEFFEELMDY